MSALLRAKASPTPIAWALLGIACLWYCSAWVFFGSEGNLLSHVGLPWFALCVFSPLVSILLAVALRRALRESGRRMRLHEILIVVLVSPHFLGAAWIWCGLAHYL
jgi:hypothetical protein